ncbi:unnamed protein product [Parnassius apollo]|uniref:(apollo) hypothetical protein n=1 Tax=Parnassius apollo TaxID=110799 RepID=A0A8S3YB61_PARAO|nr:unnamed protein product [Parnassius apollo]
MAPSQGEPLPLPASAEEVKDIDSFYMMISKLTSCISTAVNVGKRVTAANTRLTSQAAEEIRTVTRSLLSIKSVASSSTPTSNSELKDEILARVREEIASVKKLVSANKSSYAQAAAATHGVPAPAGPTALRSSPPATKPAIIVIPTVEFDTETQRNDTLTRLEGKTEIKAEPVRKLRPMVILKGISKDVPADDLTKIIRQQNEEINEIISDDGDGLKLRFKRNNKKNNLYNVVLLVDPKCNLDRCKNLQHEILLSFMAGDYDIALISEPYIGSGEQDKLHIHMILTNILEYDIFTLNVEPEPELTNMIHSACRASMHVKSRGTKPKAPWWTEELETLKREVVDLHHQLHAAKRQGMPLEHILETRKQKKELYANKMHEESTRHFREFCGLQTKENVWSLMNRLLKNATPRRPPVTLNRGSTYTTDSQETAKALLDHFYPDDSPDTLTRHHELRSEMTDLPQSHDDPPFTQEEVLECLKQMSPKKAPGLDNLTSDICLQFATDYLRLLTDILNRCLILQHFPDHIQCPNNIFGLIQDYVRDRVVILDYAGRRVTKTMSKGCIQGSTYGPVLWNIILDELLDVRLPAGCHIQAFGNDVDTAASVGELGSAANLALHHIVDYGKSVKLAFGPTKTKLIAFTPKAKVASINMDGHRLSFVPEVKLLGVILDEKVNFGKHVKHLINKAVRIFNTLCMYSRPTWGAHPENISTTYHKVIVLTITYAAGIWGHVAQKRCIRRALGSMQRGFAIKAIRGFRSVSSSAALALAQFMPLDLKVWEVCAMERARLLDLTINDTRKCLNESECKSILEKEPFEDIVTLDKYRPNNKPEESSSSLSSSCEDEVPVDEDDNEVIPYDSPIGIAIVIRTSQAAAD